LLVANYVDIDSQLCLHERCFSIFHNRLCCKLNVWLSGIYLYDGKTHTLVLGDYPNPPAYLGGAKLYDK